MQGLIIYSKTGDVLSAEEIEVAHRVTDSYAGHNVGVVNHVDVPTGVVVEFHRSNRIAFVQGGNSIYFGYNAVVDMRCFCRGVVLAETSAPAVLYVVNWGDGFYLALSTSGSAILSYGKFSTKESAQAAADAINAANAAAAHQRSAAFLTDGTELASAPIVKTIIQPPPYEIYTESNSFAYKNWLGGTKQPLYERHVQYGVDNHILSGSMSFEVPDDACLPESIFGVGLYHLGDEAQTRYFIRRDNSVPSLSDVSYDGFYSKQFSGVVNQDIQMSVLVDIVDNQIKPALQREYKRRKKCSDGQMAYLRNGFMSPEIERFVKAYHPVSALVRRDIPMQIVSEPVHTLINEERDADNALIASTYECRVVLKYETVGDEGIITAHEKEFIGQVRFTDYTATYTNYPLLGSHLNGGATPVYQAFRDAYNLIHIATMLWIYHRTGRQIVHDEDSDVSSLFCVVNGTLVDNPNWNPTDEFSGIGVNYVPGEAVQSSYGDLNISHPQFLLDYIAVSKPIEKELDAGGNKVPVMPSTSWLSSRLTDKEIVTVVPLHHVGSSYGNYGMFPLPNFNSSYIHPIDNDVSELRIFGYAEFQYNADTASFTFKKWVELTSDGKVSMGFDDEYTLDDENNPSLITITSNGTATSYNLAPKSFAYYPSWGSTNCVCISNKVIWSDIKADAKEQKTNIADVPPEGYVLTDEERLYHEVRKAIK